MNIEFGFSRRNINPVRKCSLAGYFNARMWDKVLDDLEVRVLTLKYDDNYFSIVQFDLVTVPMQLADAINEKIKDSGKFSKERMIITATHTHTGPQINNGTPQLDLVYREEVANKAVEALNDSIKNLEVGKIFTTKTREDRFAFNRRYWMKDGTVLTNPGKCNPAIDRPEGKTDYEIPLLGIKNHAGELKVLLANIVNHADTIGGNSVSGDWPGLLVKKLEKLMGSASMFIPLIGCEGNINHFDINDLSAQSSYQEAERITQGYASTIQAALDDLRETEITYVKAANTYVKVKAREISEQEVSEARKILKKYQNIPDAEKSGGILNSEDLAKKTPAAMKYFAQKLLAVADDEKINIFNLVGIALENIRIVSLPLEPFVEIGLEIKQEILSDNFVMVAALSNGTGNYGGGYIPNKWNYGRGGYETTPRSNPFSVETSEKLLQGIKELKKELQL